MRRLFIVLMLVAVAAACQPDPQFTNSNGRLLAERTLAPGETVAPTLFVLPSATPVIVPTSVVEVPPQPLATAQQNTFIMVTPTQPPSKTPTTTPTQTIQPTVTPTATTTNTPQPTATSLQFAFRNSAQSSSAEEATAFARAASGQAPPAQQRPPVSADNPNPFLRDVVPAPGAGNLAPATNCTGDQWFFSQGFPSTCATSAPASATASYQQFESGYMVWLGADNQIYVIYNSQGSPRWERFADNWNEGMPEIANNGLPEYIPDRQVHQPKRGFGLLWSQNTRVNDRIGWSVSGYEVGYDAQFQPGENGSMALSDPWGGVFFLAPNGETWDLYRTG